MTSILDAEIGSPEKHVPKLLVFHLSGLDCAFPLDAVREIVPMARLSSPPGMPSAVAGFLALRGTAIPILRLDRLFDLSEQRPGLYTPLIILRGVCGRIGVLVESVRGIVPAPPERMLIIPEDRTFRGCATGAMELDGDVILVLSPVGLIEQNEGRLLAEYSAMSQARMLQMEERA